MMNDPDHLLEQYFSGEASPQEFEKVEQWLREDAAHRRRFLRRAAVERFLAEYAVQRAHPRHHAATDRPRVWFDPTTRRRHALRWAAWAAAAVVVVMVTIAVYERPILTRRGPAIVATLTKTEDAVFEGADASMRPGSALPAGSIELVAGKAQITFASSAVVDLTAPCHFQMTGPNSGRLVIGKLDAYVRSKAHGFTVETPLGVRVTDLGTRFSMIADDHNPTTVRVVVGRVIVARRSSSMQLTADQGLRFRSDGSFQRFDVIRPTVTDAVDGVHFLHYRFDAPVWSAEAQHEVFRDTGEGFPGGPFDAIVVGSPAPAVLNKDHALALNGRSYLRTDFTGITGDHPRTIAFRMRIRRKAATDSGSSVVSWGDPDHDGDYWQIEWNWWDKPRGGLRVFLGGHIAVLGQTNLRDGHWHHIAVTLDDRGPALTARQVQLYVDGELDQTWRDPAAAVHTAASQPLCIGRGNFGHHFRGDIGDLYIFDAALSAQQIRRLADSAGTDASFSPSPPVDSPPWNTP